MIEGALVNLRTRETTDAGRAWRWVNDPEVTRTLLVRYPWSMAAEEAFYRNSAERPMAYGDASFSIETKDGVHIGACGLHRMTPEDRAAELGIFIGEADYRGKGYGADAVRTLVRFAFDEMNLHRVYLHVFDFNERGIAAYRKAGFVEEGRMREEHYQAGAHHDIVIMAVVRDEGS